MSFSDSSTSVSSSRTRIRILLPKSSSQIEETPVRNNQDHHEVSPTPRRDTMATKASSMALTTASSSLEDGHDLSPAVLEGLGRGRLDFPINEECTSLKIVPNSHLVVAGFTDGTLRLFDLNTPKCEDDFDGEFKHHAVVCSKTYQKYGAVACQIHARGVHTSLLMHVDCADDGLYCFGGVIRGSMELVAVDLSQLSKKEGDLLDQIQVHRHSDAKLKGFGACTRLAGETPKYLLLTGLGIKNIHIWTFAPSAKQDPWQCLYDTQTNGSTINYLHLRYDPNGLLQAISKSDLQKIRVWDLSYEQHEGNALHKLYNKSSIISQLRKKSLSNERPKRPPYVDVASTESALGVAGALSFGGGYNQVRVVSLDVENVTFPYNHSEMALPGEQERTSRRQQRGDLQSIARVAGMSKDASHVLLELSNGAIVHYSQDSTSSDCRLKALDMFSFPGRNLCLGYLGSAGFVVAAMSIYNANSGRGSILLKPLDPNHVAFISTSPKADKNALAAATVGPSPEDNRVTLFAESTASPKVVTTTKKKKPQMYALDETPVAASAKRKSVPTSATATHETPRPSVEAARVSLGENDGKAIRTATPKGAAVSPEFQSTTTEKAKKTGAMMKYLRRTEAGKAMKTSGNTTGDGSKGTGNESVLPSLSSNKMRKDTEPFKVASNLAEESVLTSLSSNTKGKDLEERPPRAPPITGSIPRKEKNVKKMIPRDLAARLDNQVAPVEEAKPERGRSRSRSPRVPRKRQQDSITTAASLAASPALADRREAMRKLETAETLIDIRKRTQSPKRPQSISGKDVTKSLDEQRPVHPKRKRPRLLAPQLPKTTVKDRVGAIISSIDTLGDAQEDARRKLAAEHRASHEMLRKKIVAALDGLICGLTRSRPLPDNEARIWFAEAMSGFSEMLEDMLERQRMEASTLAAMQSVERKGQSAPELQVSFPFPNLFAFADLKFEQFLQGEKA